MQFNRILLKLSGESLKGDKLYGIDETRLSDYAKQIQEAVKMGIQVAIVMGGGNIFRGLRGISHEFDRLKGDQMGILATVINSLALSVALEKEGIKGKVFTAVRMEPIGQLYSREEAMEALEKEKIAIIAGGTGNPIFTTDMAAVLRAIELKAQVMLKGTRVDGVYTEDPEKNPKARKFNKISYDEIYRKNLKIMDLTAITMAKDNHLPVIVFDMDTFGNLQKILSGETIGTLVQD